MAQTDFKYSDLTSKIIGCAFEVHKVLGNGFQEVIYQRALAHEFSLQEISFSREHEMPIFYKNKQIGTRRVDFFVNNAVLVEIKAIKCLENIHLAQGKNYLEAYNIDVGLLLNFGSMSVEVKRLVNSRCY